MNNFDILIDLFNYNPSDFLQNNIILTDDERNNLTTFFKGIGLLLIIPVFILFFIAFLPIGIAGWGLMFIAKGNFIIGTLVIIGGIALGFWIWGKFID